MYFDNRPCEVCGSEVRLRSHDPDAQGVLAESDATVDDRVCTNPDCATNQGGADAPQP
jgi:hypothetical protein